MDLRKTARVVFVFVGPVGAGLWLAGFPTTAGSGTAEFEVLKTVRGTAPPGTQFEVTIACDGVTIVPPGQSQVVLRFDAAGTTQDANAVRFEGEGTCTVTETGTGGAASVTYECAITAGKPGIPGLCTLPLGSAHGLGAAGDTHDLDERVFALVAGRSHG
jgi:hypothetical protein